MNKQDEEREKREATEHARLMLNIEEALNLQKDRMQSSACLDRLTKESDAENERSERLVLKSIHGQSNQKFAVKVVTPNGTYR